MTNEEKILEMLTKMQVDIDALKKRSRRICRIYCRNGREEDSNFLLLN